MSSEHTPAPWHVGQGNGEGSVFSETGRMRCEKGGTSLYPICTVIDFDGEAEANAKLIAAAPELLCGLRRIIEWIDAGCDPSAKSIEDAQAAIEKATGY